MILSCIMCLPVSTEASTDTIASFPFVEDWSSLSFDTNGWTFPYTQGNWAISTGEGNPAPCAVFTGHPSNSNYIYTLESPVFDARGLTCDELYLCFDVQFNGVNFTGLEKLSVALIVDTSEFNLLTYRNTGPVSWNSDTLNIRKGAGHFFKFRFTAFGTLSSNFIDWGIDNISVFRKCKQPRDIIAWGHGVCTWSESLCYTTVTWLSPYCEFNSYVTTLMYDDGSAENGWAINPGYIAWMGNEFPLSTMEEGIIQSIDVWFGFNTTSAVYLTIDIFDSQNTYVGSSEPFIPPVEGWKTVPCNNIPFSGRFFAMVKRDNVASATNFFGYDENGPYSQENLEWYYDGSIWDKMSNVGGSPPGVFLIRPTVLMNGKKGTINPGGTFKPEIDSTNLVGYNVYRNITWSNGPASEFTLIGFVPAPDTIFHDTISCWAEYFVTALFSNNCESELHYEITDAGCYTALPDPLSEDYILISPNPAGSEITIRSDKPVSRISIIDLTGKVMQFERYEGKKNVVVDITGHPCGIYIVTVETVSGISVHKLVIQR